MPWFLSRPGRAGTCAAGGAQTLYLCTKIDLTLKNPSVFQHFNASCAEIIDFYNTKCYAAKYSQPRLRSQGNAAKVTPQVTQSSLHSQGYLCDGYAAKVILLRLHIQGCIAEVTQPRIRSQGYAPGYTANLAQPMLRSQGYAPGYTSMLA